MRVRVFPPTAFPQVSSTFLALKYGMLKLLALGACVAVAHAGCTSHPSKCYQDGVGTRVLGPTNVNGGDTLTREYCAQLCHDAGFEMAGVEFGHECYCGNDVAGTAVAVPATDCSQPCDLDGPIPSKETCGNSFRIDIFDANCSGSPVPPPPGTSSWSTCGGLTPQLNHTACPLAHATCCTQLWMPSDGNWGCCPYPNAVCCSNGYTCCPSGSTCQDNGSGWGVVTTCKAEPTRTLAAASSSSSSSLPDPDKGLGAQVCKSGGHLPASTSLKNVVIMGDSVSIGYAPFIATALQDVALVQHSPWGGDGGVEETEYGWRCIEYLLRAPDGTFQAPDVIWFNWGLHNDDASEGPVQTIPGQAGPSSAYAPYLDLIARRLSQLGAKTKLIFGLTSPMLCNKTTDDVVQANNVDAKAIMGKYGVGTVDMHAAIVGKCGPVPQATCFNSTGCFCPHCPAFGGEGYEWLANSLIAPAIRRKLAPENTAEED